MLTKETYARYLLDEFKLKHNLPLDTKDEVMNKYVLTSSSVGIALEKLNKLDPGYKGYVAERHGKFVIDGLSLASTQCPDRIKFLSQSDNALNQFVYKNTLTVRELMSLLPSEKD